ncbi:hypothetical protein [Microbacterium capsulatum]|uniref:Uncharacterized protein n=1 Tax=Microbacterium capsulatum TaxID=3041921 RepID=A0ABU0XL06_9MICO|nr:hypothetical protein [Microbacterium sp. ASV81]MDQ4215253.1 hypothetical protein [Microbacterium sp. ASV81]
MKQFARRASIALPIPVVIVVLIPGPVSAKVFAIFGVALILLLVQAMEWAVISKRKENGYDRRVPLRDQVEEDVRHLRTAGDMWISHRGDRTAFRSAAHVDQRVENLKSTAEGRVALTALLRDSSPVVQLIAAEAVVEWDAAAARDAAEEVLCEPAYYDWILQRAATDLAQWTEHGSGTS